MSLNLPQKKNHLLVAFLCAVLAHAGLVLVKLSDYQIEPISLHQSLSVRLQKIAEPIEESKPPEAEESLATEETLKTIEPTQPELELEEEIAITTVADPEQDQSIGAAIINTPEFRKWLKDEAERHIKNNPDSLEEFAQSFELPILEKPPNIGKEGINFGTGVYMTRVNGKERCHIQVAMPYNDGWSGNVNLSKDCTKPENTFEFEMK